MPCVRHSPSTLLLLCLVGGVLAGCSGHDFSDLDAFMEEKRSARRNHCAHLQHSGHEAFAYSATTLRSPFDRPIEVREIAQLPTIAAIRERMKTAPRFWNNTPLTHSVDGWVL